MARSGRTRKSRTWTKSSRQSRWRSSGWGRPCPCSSRSTAAARPRRGSSRPCCGWCARPASTATCTRRCLTTTRWRPRPLWSSSGSSCPTPVSARGGRGVRSAEICPAPAPAGRIGGACSCFLFTQGAAAARVRWAQARSGSSSRTSPVRAAARTLCAHRTRPACLALPSSSSPRACARLCCLPLAPAALSTEQERTQGEALVAAVILNYQKLDGELEGAIQGSQQARQAATNQLRTTMDSINELEQFVQGVLA